MEQIMQFLEQYWGYTLFGSVTVGVLVTDIILIAKLIVQVLRANKKNDDNQIQLTAVLKAFAEQSEVLKQVRTELAKVIEEKSQQSLLFNRVQAVTFKSISFLIMASKLPNEDKEAIMKDINSITNAVTTKQVAQITADEVVPEVTEESNEVEVVEAVEKAQTLLDKYNDAV